MSKVSKVAFNDPTGRRAMELLARGEKRPKAARKPRRRNWQTADPPGMSPGQAVTKRKRGGEKK